MSPRRRRPPPMLVVWRLVAAAATAATAAATLAAFFFGMAAAAPWTVVPVPAPPRGREETAFAACGGGRYCLVGGRGRHTTAIYDTASASWSTGAAPAIELHHFQATLGPDGCVWAAGAWTGGYPREATVAAIHTYCPEGDTWGVRPAVTIPRPRGAGGAAWVGGRLFLVGGNVGGHGAHATTVGWVDVYDPVADTWTALPDMPHPRDHFQVAVAKGRLVAAGGRDSGVAAFFNATIAAVDVMDLATLTWLPDGTAQDLPSPRAGAGTAALDSRIVVAGGEGYGVAWATVSALDAATGSWTTLPPLVEARHGTGLVSCGGFLTTVAGAGAQAGGIYRTTTETYHETAAQGVLLPPPCGTGVGTVPGAPTPPVVALPTAAPQTTPPALSTPPAVPEGPSTVPGASQTPTPSAGVSPSPSTPGNGGRAPPSGDVGQDPSSSTIDASSSPDAPACFPASATVATADGRVVRMADLRLGDRIRVVSASTRAAGWSQVILFSHATGGGAGGDSSGDGGGKPPKYHPFVELVVASAVAVDGDGGACAATTAATGAPSCRGAPPSRLRLSAGHLLPVGADAQLRPARSVAVGDTVWVLAPGAAANGSSPRSSATTVDASAAAMAATVTGVTVVTAAGLYNPHTAAADDRLVVDGWVVADTTDALPQAVATAGLMIVRSFATAGGWDVTRGGLAGKSGWGRVARRLLVALTSVRGR